MIEYVIAHNPDDRILQKASDLLHAGKLICFPSDTNWILAASVGSKSAIEKLYKIKKENKQKHFSLLCHDISTASEYAVIDNTAFKMLKKLVPGHYTFIFEATKKIAKLIQASKTDKEIGIRFVPRELISKVIEAHGMPLISSNIPLHLFEQELIYSYDLEDKLRGLVEMIIDPGEFEFDGPSSIIDFSQGTGPMLVREGAGDCSFLR